MTGRVVGTLTLVDVRLEDEPCAPMWAITAEPDVVIRLKRILPSIRTSRADTLYVSDTEQIARELEWVNNRWLFEMTSADRRHLRRRAAADRRREALVAGIVGGSTAVAPQPDWISPSVPLRGYQRVAVGLAKASGALLLGDELGGGKTAMSLALLEDPAARPALAVILTGLGGQWLRELNKFYPALKGYEIQSTKAGEEFVQLCGPDGKISYDLILVNYAKLAAWRYHLAGKVRSVIFDEVQELRRPESLKYEAAEHIASKAVTRIGLSGTPIYNFGGEIFAVMNGLDRGCLGQRSEFIREWCGGATTSTETTGTMAKVRVDKPEALRAHLEGRGLPRFFTGGHLGLRVVARRLCLGDVGPGVAGIAAGRPR